MTSHGIEVGAAIVRASGVDPVILLVCECGWHNYPSTGDLDDLKRLGESHRMEATQKERDEVRAAELASHRWHLWARTKSGAEFVYNAFDDQAEAERQVALALSMGWDMWLVDRDAT